VYALIAENIHKRERGWSYITRRNLNYLNLRSYSFSVTNSTPTLRDLHEHLCCMHLSKLIFVMQTYVITVLFNFLPQKCHKVCPGKYPVWVVTLCLKISP
jgi:hypothetical protein